MNALIALLLLFTSISIIDSLNLDEICFKDFECDGKHCTLLKCSNSLSYDCDKFTCTSDFFKCDEYHSMDNELESKKKSKLHRAFTEGLIKGIGFSSKRLKKIQYLIKSVKVCAKE